MDASAMKDNLAPSIKIINVLTLSPEIPIPGFYPTDTLISVQNNVCRKPSCAALFILRKLKNNLTTQQGRLIK